MAFSAADVNNQIAADSKLIAAASREDSAAIKTIAQASLKDSDTMKQIAFETKKDSSAMKTIALLTMFFLLGTFVAVSFLLLYVYIDELNISTRPFSLCHCSTGMCLKGCRSSRIDSIIIGLSRCL